MQADDDGRRHGMAATARPRPARGPAPGAPPTLDLWDIALGFMDAQVLLTAHELGVFEALGTGPRDARAVAAAAGLPVDSAERLLTGLCALGVVRRRADGRYANGPEAAAQLVRGRPRYIGGLVGHLREDLYPLWRHLPEALREGRAQWARAFGAGARRNDARHEDPAALGRFLDGMHAITYAAAAQFARDAPELAGVETLVDVGGASGAFVIALAERLPRLRGVVFDLPPVRPIAEARIARSGLGDRLRFQAGDFWTDPLPAGADAYSLGFVLHDWEDSAGALLLDKVAAAGRPGALLVVGEQLLDDDRTGPRWVARSHLNMLVAARGRERTAAEYAAWLAGHGFALRRVHPSAMGKSFLLFARR